MNREKTIGSDHFREASEVGTVQLFEVVGAEGVHSLNRIVLYFELPRICMKPDFQQTEILSLCHLGGYFPEKYSTANSFGQTGCL